MRHAAVLGSPIAHSLSPVLHRAAYAALGISDVDYQRIEVTAAGLSGVLAGCDATWVGLSLTMPLKTVVLDVVRDRSALVERTGVANTVLMSHGQWRLDNTDVHGLATAVAQAGADLSDVVLLGAGATARSACAALSDLGVRDMTVVARDVQAMEALRGIPTGGSVHTEQWSDPQIPGRLARASLVISTVPVSAQASIAGEMRHPQGRLLDVVYDPWPTPLQQAWPSSAWISGLEMLLAQAVPQVEQMLHVTCDADVVAAMRRALSDVAPPGALDPRA